MYNVHKLSCVSFVNGDYMKGLYIAVYKIVYEDHQLKCWLWLDGFIKFWYSAMKILTYYIIYNT